MDVAVAAGQRSQAFSTHAVWLPGGGLACGLLAEHAQARSPCAPKLAAMKKLLRPSVVIPTTLSAALLTVLLGFSHPARVLAVMEGFQHLYLLYVLALMVAYEAVRCAQWGLLLEALGVRVSLRTLVFTFLGGEITESLPVGTYFRNYLLQRATGTAFGRSSAATTLSIVTEVAICLVGLVILGLGGWSV